MAVVEQRVTVTHEKGLHARPASEFVQMASNFDAEIQVRTEDGREGDAKSSLSVMSLGVEGGDEILIRSDGPDGEEAVSSLVELIEDDFELNVE
jgi:phosphocarrier protein